jgi:hypothetical protein
MLTGTTPSPAPPYLGQVNLSNSSNWHPAPIPTRTPFPNLRSPFLSEAGPSRSHTPRPTTRHQPYLQSRPEWQGPFTDYSPVHDHAKRKGRETPFTALNHGLQTPDTSPPRTRLEVCTRTLGCCALSNTFCKHIAPITRPHDEVFTHSPFHLSTTLRQSGSPRSVTGISAPTQLAQVLRYPTGAIASDKFNCPATTQEGSMPGYHTQPRLRQLQTDLAGSHGLTMYLPTPPMGTNSLPDPSPRLPLEGGFKRSPQRANQKRRPETLNQPTAPGPSRCATQQSVSHPYARPVNVR